MTTNTTAAKIESVVVELDEPLTRGNTQITELTLRRPKSGALRGVSLMDLMNMNVSALQVVLPRISEPRLGLPIEVEDAMADIATVFHWPPAAMDDLELADLMKWRERARVRGGAE